MIPDRPPPSTIPNMFVECTLQGSTSFKLSESLSSCGLRTGLFVSPHLASFRERVQVNSQLISEEAFVQHLPTVLKLCADHSIPATLFELTFILACLHYESEKCEVVVLEVSSALHVITSCVCDFMTISTPNVMK
jgi:dihydrofolate synthase / folylpolyglutamate synthase